MSDPISARKSHYQELVELLLQPDAVREMGEFSPELPPHLSAWLGELILLKRVPFEYLVPDERMLPVESIRFFKVDANWLASLVDGANSIGRVLEGDHALDKALFADVIFEQARRAAGITAPVLSGFLLRSQAVAGWWPGIRVDGYAEVVPDAQSRPNDYVTPHVQILRLEILSPTVLICLFDGEVQQVNIHEPAEGLHFGFDRPDAEGDTTLLYKKLKQVQGEGQVGNPLPASTRLTVQEEDTDTRFVRPSRVVKVAALAGAIRSGLVDAGALGVKDPYTAAEFALEMVEGVDLVRFVTK